MATLMARRHAGRTAIVASVESSGSFSPRLPGLDEKTPGMGDERSFGLDGLVQLGQRGPVALDGEIGDGPDDLAEEVDDGADVVERGPQGRLPEIDDLEAGGRGG